MPKGPVWTPWLARHPLGYSPLRLNCPKTAGELLQSITNPYAPPDIAGVASCPCLAVLADLTLKFAMGAPDNATRRHSLSHAEVPRHNEDPWERARFGSCRQNSDTLAPPTGIFDQISARLCEKFRNAAFREFANNFSERRLQPAVPGHGLHRALCEK